MQKIAIASTFAIIMVSSSWLAFSEWIAKEESPHRAIVVIEGVHRRAGVGQLTAISVVNREKIEALEKFFPNYRQHPTSDLAGGWELGATIYFDFSDGRSVRVGVSQIEEDGKKWWTVGKGDFIVQGNFAAYLKQLRDIGQPEALGQGQNDERPSSPPPAASAQAAPQEEFSNKPSDLPKELANVDMRLREACRQCCPSAGIRYNDGGRQIVVEYRTRDFQVYSIFKDGKIAEQLYDQLGPTHVGFLLQVTFQDGLYIGAAVPGQDHRHPYWTTYFTVVESADKKSHLHVRLSYGSRSDRELLGELKKAIGIKTVGARG